MQFIYQWNSNLSDFFGWEINPAGNRKQTGKPNLWETRKRTLGGKKPRKPGKKSWK